MGVVQFEPRILQREECARALGRYHHHLNGHPIEILHLCHTRNDLVATLLGVVDRLRRDTFDPARIEEYIRERLDTHGEIIEAEPALDAR